MALQKVIVDNALMSIVEEREYYEFGKALDVGQKTAILKAIPTEMLVNELQRRTDTMVSNMKELYDKVNSLQSNTTYMELEQIACECKGIARRL